MNTWIRLSGSPVWHRPPNYIPRPKGHLFDAALCGNPGSGIVLSATTTEKTPPGPECPACTALIKETT